MPQERPKEIAKKQKQKQKNNKTSEAAGCSRKR